jgi:hypothetical protein
MLKRRLPNILMLVLLFAGIANAEETGFTAFGIDMNMSCGKYIQDIETSSETEAFYSWWLAGFVTGTNLSKKRIIFTDNFAHEAWINKYCRENPLESFAQAVIELDKALYKN